jgi:hypothetical protein
MKRKRDLERKMTIYMRPASDHKQDALKLEVFVIASLICDFEDTRPDLSHA